MNPFLLRGSAFLLFYLVVCCAVIATVALLRQLLEKRTSVPALDEIDPYLVAHLRGGTNEALRVAVVSLLDRGLLSMEGDLLAAAPQTTRSVRRPLERAVLGHFSRPGMADSIFSSVAREVCQGLEADLRSRKLLPGRAERWARILLPWT